MFPSPLTDLLERWRKRAQIGYRDYARCLPDYLLSLAAAAYLRRNHRLAVDINA
jgi:hypothetical protein